MSTLNIPLLIEDGKYSLNYPNLHIDLTLWVTLWPELPMSRTIKVKKMAFGKKHTTD